MYELSVNEHIEIYEFIGVEAIKKESKEEICERIISYLTDKFSDRFENDVENENKLSLVETIYKFFLLNIVKKEEIKITDQDIKLAISKCFKNNPSFRVSTDLVTFVYKILRSLFIDDINYVLLHAPTGTGKCQGKNTPILMFDGTIKMIQDVIEGDLLMGDDSTPRKVLSTTKGVDEMYRVTPTKGDSYTINSSHILSLKLTNKCSDEIASINKRKTNVSVINGVKYNGGDVVNINVLEYLKLSKTKKHLLKGYRVPIEFEPNAIDSKISPRLLGLWLADVNERKMSFTFDNGDVEIINYLYEQHNFFVKRIRVEYQTENSNNYHFVGDAGNSENKSLTELRALNLLENKHIPHQFLTATRQERLELLAGIIDGDGSYDTSNCFSLTLKSERLMDDVIFLSRSLGFACYKKPTKKGIKKTGFVGDYFNISISGDIDEIPTLLPRKKAKTRQQKKDVLVTGIKVEPIGEGEYYGFTLDGNHLYLMGDFTVTHNTVYAYILSECFNDLLKEIKKENEPKNYLLTSSLILQKQIQGDIERFKLNSTHVLKGGANYRCDDLSDKMKTHHTFIERGCKSLKFSQVEMLDCYDTCGYLQARLQAEHAELAVLNYQYFNVAIKSYEEMYDEDGNAISFYQPRFSTRSLTICDEAHLIPEIVINKNKIDITVIKYVKLKNKINNILNIKPNDTDLKSAEPILESMRQLYFKKSISLEDVILIFGYEEFINTIINKVKKDIKNFASIMGEDVEVETANQNTRKQASRLLYSLSTRPEDMLIETTWDEKNKCYMHTIYDMNEFYVLRNNFLSKINKGIFMSGSLKPFTEFGNLMGMYKDEYVSYDVPHTFDFTKSPIYCVNSAWLNFKNFDKNIQKVLSDTLKVCEADVNYNLAGVIHTSTFNISNMLNVLVNSGKVKDPTRYLFYENSTQKNEMLQKMIDTPNNNFLIIGPSLLEGISLDDDLGRLNIFIKVPYSGLTEYLREKIARIPYFYKRNTLEKCVQGIGRTNRHKKDWSKTYLMDSSFVDLIFDCEEEIIKRVTNFK